MNQTTVTGTVVNTWWYKKDFCFRIELRDGGGHVSVRWLKSNPPQLSNNALVIVAGALTSREERVGLAGFARRAEGGQGEPLSRDEIKALEERLGEENRTYTEIVAEEVIVLAEPVQANDRERRGERRRGDRAATG